MNPNNSFPLPAPASTSTSTSVGRRRSPAPYVPLRVIQIANNKFLNSIYYRLAINPIVSGVFFALGNFLVIWLFKSSFVQDIVKGFYSIFE